MSELFEGWAGIGVMLLIGLVSALAGYTVAVIQQRCEAGEKEGCDG